MISLAPSMAGWLAVATGVVGLFAIAFIILLYTVGGPFGKLNDICNGLLGILSGVLAATLYVQYRAGLYTMAGFAAIGMWLVGQNLVAQQADGWPQSLVITGLVVGGLMALGLVAIPGIFSGINSWENSPWYIRHVGMAASSLGWLVLFPVWCIGLGRLLLLE